MPVFFYLFYVHYNMYCFFSIVLWNYIYTYDLKHPFISHIVRFGAYTRKIVWNELRYFKLQFSSFIVNVMKLPEMQLPS